MNSYDIRHTHALQTAQKRLQNEVTPKNRRIIQEYIDYLQSERRSKGTLAMNICDLILIDNFFTGAQIKKVREGKGAERRALKRIITARINKEQSLKDLTKEQIIEFCNYLNNDESLSERRRMALKSLIKRFQKFLSGNEDYPDNVRWIQGKQLIDMRKYRVKTRQDLPTEAEKIKILRACDNPQDKCLFEMLMETGERPRELLMTQIKDCDITKDGVFININEDTKTGQRTIPAINCRQSLIEWLNVHPYRDNPEAWLFINQKSAKRMKQVGYLALRRRFRTILERAGIKRKITLYFFRHASYTGKADAGFSESDIKLYHGLKQNSRVLDTYIHRDPRGLMDRMKEMNGQPVKKKKHITEIKIKVCPNCKTENSISNTRCKECGIIIDLKVLNELEKEKEQEKKELQDQITEMRNENSELKNAVEKDGKKIDNFIQFQLKMLQKDMTPKEKELVDAHFKQFGWPEEETK